MYWYYSRQQKEIEIRFPITNNINSGSIIKVVPLLLILILLYNSFGYIIVHLSRIAVIKSEMQKIIAENPVDHDNYKILSFTQEEIESSNPTLERIDEREFRYNGNMYDIVREEIKGEKIIFYCILDKKENLLELLFTEKFLKENRGDSTQNISSFYVLKYLPDYILDAKISQPDNSRVINYFVASEKNQSFLFTKIPTPPPQFS